MDTLDNPLQLAEFKPALYDFICLQAIVCRQNAFSALFTGSYAFLVFVDRGSVIVYYNIGGVPVP